MVVSFSSFLNKNRRASPCGFCFSCRLCLVVVEAIIVETDLNVSHCIALVWLEGVIKLKAALRSNHAPNFPKLRFTFHRYTIQCAPSRGTRLAFPFFN